jgi:hypothetical protein
MFGIECYRVAEPATPAIDVGWSYLQGQQAVQPSESLGEPPGVGRLALRVRAWGAALGPQLSGTWGTAEDSRRQRTSRSAAVYSAWPGARNHWSELSHGRDYALLGSEDLVGGTDCLHPNDAGHQKIAEAFAAVLAGADARAAA